MSEVWFQNTTVMDRLRRSWLKESIEGCWDELAARGYKRGSLCACARAWLTFGEFVATKADCRLEHLHLWVEPFLGQLPVKHAKRVSDVRSLIHALIRYLVRHGVVPPLPPPPPRDVHAHAALVDAYARFRAEHRGLTARVHATRRCCDQLLAHLNGTCEPALADATPEAVRRLLVSQGQRYQRVTMVNVCSTVRGFLAWLHGRRATSHDLAAVVLAPRVFKHEQCPRYLTGPQVQAALAAVDRDTPVGRRDYAMLLLLAVYGLRGCEVQRLRLDDIDWPRQVLHVRNRKAGNSTSYPLADSVADAIVAYLRAGRPAASPHREVFLKLRPPHPPLGRRFGKQVCKYLDRAGVTIARPGPHTFRYSCAQRLFAEGMSLKSVGDYLGHGSPDSTLRYTKIDVDQLRAVACNAGEDLL